MASAEQHEYGANEITVLEGLEAVRKRPGMYIGSTGERGLHHLVWEVVANSVDEAMAGYADKVEVTLHQDGSVEVHDNGRGIPTDKEPKTGLPGVEVVARNGETRPWKVGGLDRTTAHLVSTSNGGPAYGGTPDDAALVEAIRDLKARGLKVTFYPFLMMDVPAGNTLPDPWSDYAAAIGQSVLPWRGRITCSPAAGFAGTVDKTAAAAYVQQGQSWADSASLQAIRSRL